MIGWIILLIGILITVSLIYLFRDDIQNWFKRNKKKAAAVLTTGAILGAGGAGVMTDLLPGGYRPPTETLISNSEGHYWVASFANLQNAIDDLDNESGWVNGGNNLITQDGILYVGDNCELYNVRLYLDDDANCTMIRNYDQTNGNANITIHDIILDGNSGGQDVWYDCFYSYTNGIYLLKCEFVEIYSVTIYDTQNMGIFVKEGSQINVHDCMFIDLASAFDESGLKHYAAFGVWYWETYDSVISGCIVDNAFSGGFVVESALAATYAEATQNVSVTGCSVYDSGVGYYMEDTSHVLFDDCMVSCGTDDACYGASTARGFFIASDVYHVTISNSIIRDTYRGVTGSPDWIEVIGCEFTNITSYAMNLAGSYTYIYNNVIADIGSNGISLGGDNATVCGNHIERCGQWSAGISIASTEDSKIFLNTIVGTGTQYPNLGVYGANSDTNCYIMFNSMNGIQYPIYQCNARVNCTDYDDWNFYSGVS